MEIWLQCSSQDPKAVSIERILPCHFIYALSSVQNLISRFLGLYTTDSPRWDDIADLATTFEWDEMSNSTCIDHLNANGVPELFTQEMISAAARVNYGQVGLFFLSGKMYD